MPRQLRQFKKDGIYHIVNRGVEKRKIYMKPQDYSRYILGLEFYNQEDSINLWPLLVTRDKFTGDLVELDFFDALVGSDPTIAERLLRERKRMQKENKPLVELLAFALMPNHLHLIIREIRKNGISKFMQKMGGYSFYFNKQYDRVGPLFQSRFKAVPITSEKQLWRVFCYVHTNPVELWEPGWKKFRVKDKRQAIKKLKEYKWSSYRDYIGEPTHTTVTQRKFFLDFFDGKGGCQAAVEDWIKTKVEIEYPNFGPEIIE